MSADRPTPQAGMLPTQLVVAYADELDRLRGTPLTRRMLLRR